MLPSLSHILAFTLSLSAGTLASRLPSGPEYDPRSLRLGNVIGNSNYTAVCAQIANAISSSSSVFYPLSLSPNYVKDNSHWMTSSSQNSACSVEPGTAQDLSLILNIVANTSTPFAVKGGGHASNPGYSSTPGVQIAMYRFGAVDYSPDTSTVVVGAGLVWDDVYNALAPYSVNVVGGRVTGVGVAGFTLGGGLSWKSNQYGLTIDNVVAYDLVLPNGTITHVTESNEDLFFALKGGFNNFGIVTQFTMKVHPQTQVWGGLITYTFDQLDAVVQATVDFQANVTDPKASIITTFNYLAGQPGVSQLLFYDYPTPPSGIFDEFLAIPYFTKDVSTRSFVSLVQSSPANATSNQRGVFNSMMFSQYSSSLVDAIVNETTFWGSQLQFQTGTFISYEVEAFLPTYLTVSTTPTAWPPVRSTSKPFLPVNIYYAWNNPISDNSFYQSIQSSTNRLNSLAASEGQDLSDSFVYGNYAIYSTPLSAIYGDNLDRLRTVKQQIDPTNIMGLAGGWKF